MGRPRLEEEPDSPPARLVEGQTNGGEKQGEYDAGRNAPGAGGGAAPVIFTTTTRCSSPHRRNSLTQSRSLHARFRQLGLKETVAVRLTPRKPLKRIGGPGRVRTDDLFHAMEARSQLRHRPTGLLHCRAPPPVSQCGWPPSAPALHLWSHWRIPFVSEQCWSGRWLQNGRREEPA